MSPPAATSTESQTNGDHKPSAKAPLEPGISAERAETQKIKFPTAPKFEDKYQEREYLKGRLAGASVLTTVGFSFEAFLLLSDQTRRTSPCAIHVAFVCC